MPVWWYVEVIFFAMSSSEAFLAVKQATLGNLTVSPHRN